MTIKLKSGRSIREDLGMDAECRPCGADETAEDWGAVTGWNTLDPREDTLTPDERHELAHVMMERWAKWGGSAPAKLVVVNPDPDSCAACPFCKGEEGVERCSADEEQRNVSGWAEQDVPRPDWCPLRTGDVVVRMQKREGP